MAALATQPAAESLEQIATVDAQGGILIPQDVRAALGMTEGSKVVFSIQSGQLIARPLTAEKEAFAKALRQKIDSLRVRMAGTPGPSASDNLEQLRDEEANRDLQIHS